MPPSCATATSRNASPSRPWGAAAIWRGVVDDGGRAVTPDGNGLLLSDRLADALDVGVGDTVTTTFETGLRETFEIPVSGIVTQYFGLGAYMEHAHLNALFRQSPRMSTVNVTLSNPFDASAFDARVTELPGIMGTIDMTENRASFRRNDQPEYPCRHNDLCRPRQHHHDRRLL